MDIGEFFASSVTSGALVLALPLAAIAGLVSFLSPCILPLVPGYLGFVSGLTDPGQPGNRRRVLSGVGLFILGLGRYLPSTERPSAPSDHGWCAGRIP